MRARKSVAAGALAATLVLACSGCPSLASRSASGESKGAASRHLDRPYTSTGATRKLEGSVIDEDTSQAQDAVEAELLRRMPTPPW